MLVRDINPLEPWDYQLDPTYTKEFQLVGKDKKEENIRLMQKSTIFNKNMKVWILVYLWLLKYLKSYQKKVSKCGSSGCKKEKLTSEEVKRVMIYDCLVHMCILLSPRRTEDVEEKPCLDFLPGYK